MTFDAPMFPLSFHLCCTASFSCGLLLYFYYSPLLDFYCAYTFFFPWTPSAIVLFPMTHFQSELVTNSSHALCHPFLFQAALSKLGSYFSRGLSGPLYYK